MRGRSEREMGVDREGVDREGVEYYILSMSLGSL